MKRSTTLIVLSFLFGFSLYASNNPVIKETDKGASIEVEIVQEGKISLFSQQTEVLPATIPEDPLASYTRTFTTYYIAKGEGELQEIHCANFKDALKDHMADNQELASKVGTKGYKFKELETIIKKYNSSH